MSEVEEFEAFLEPTFGAVPFAASLLQATNVIEDAELDIQTALKKLRFDAAECDKRIESLTSTNHSHLFHNLFSVESVHQKLEETLEPSSKRLVNTYKRIDHELVQPYDAAVRLNTAFSRIHQTLQLLRGCSFFVLFLQQLNSVNSSGDNDADEETVVRTARIYKSMIQFYGAEELAKLNEVFDNNETGNRSQNENQNSNSNTVNQNSNTVNSNQNQNQNQNSNTVKTSDLSSILRPVRLVQDYKPLLVSKYSLFCNQLSSRISHDLGHHNSFVSTNRVLQKHLAAFHLLQPHAFLALMESAAISKSIQVSLTSLTRALQSPRVLVSTLNDVGVASKSFVEKLSSVLSVAELSDHSPRTLLQVLESSLGTSLECAFYERLCQKFKKSLAVTLARGGPIARNLRAQSAAISDAVSSTLTGPAAVCFEDAFSIMQ